MKAKLPYTEALGLAQTIVDQLKSYCERIEIAGSIRRQKPEVGDIEIVAIPRYQVDVDLFGETQRSTSLLDFPLNAAITTGGWALIKGGSLYKQFDIGPCCLDLFITTPEKWGVVFTIRTGSADFSHRLVTAKRYGGLLPSHLKVKDGRVWCGDTALDTPEEADVFKVLGLGWIEPKDRS